MELKEYLNEKIQDVLNYIEKESENWDEKELSDNGKMELMQLILEASCKQFFVSLHKDFEKQLFPILSLPEKTLYDESEFFYCDCLNSLAKQNIDYSDEELNFSEFYNYFIKFIQNVRKIEIKEDMRDELQQLIKLLNKVYFTAGDKDSLDKKSAHEALRYVEIDEKNIVEIDVLKQTQRFWLIWIVEESPKKVTQKSLLSKNMKKQEMYIWILLAAIYNFAEKFGNDELKALRKSILHFQKKNEKDIGHILKWCFMCLFSIIEFDIDNQIINESDYLLKGIFSLIDRFDYVHYTVKSTLKEEMESFWETEKKHFASQLAYDAWTAIKIDSIGSPEKLINGWVKENNKLRLSSKEFVQRDVKKIWSDINVDNLFIKYDVKEEESEIVFYNQQINFFTAYIITSLLNRISSNGWKYGLISIIHIIFKKLNILMSEFTDKDLENWIENDFQEIDDKLSIIIDIINSLVEKYLEIYKVYDEIICFCLKNVVNKIFSDKKIKVSKKLISNLLKRNALEFEVNNNGYISWVKF